mgnify:CR=1 FL=1
MDMLTTPRLGVPLLAAGQAQKDITHNEALLLLDAAIAPAVLGTAASPPADPAEGDCWLVAAAATGAWLGADDSLAVYTAGGWRYCTLPLGAMLFDQSSGTRLVRDISGWVAPGVVPIPTGGTVVDTEARAALSALLTALVQTGLIA